MTVIEGLDTVLAELKVARFGYTLSPAQIAVLLAAIERLTDPEWFNPASDPEYSVDATDLYSLDLDVGGICRLHGARSTGDVWAAHVVLTLDDDGHADETEYQLFASKAEALAAVVTPSCVDQADGAQ